ncbi:Uncharacterised protein [Mycobacterium tuberculosis]|uniref:Uncharacterized protein n=1 Tax=Mycobacterium tuberculosis TaxID=1773 RepID=A0A916LDC0_MYCTX|nr:Uncharacterised protein [Mycobacterium tuberculosis]COZ06389.1 Uncharacterised protein [Mycobacterium tuberculosis]
MGASPTPAKVAANLRMPSAWTGSEAMIKRRILCRSMPSMSAPRLW